MSVCLVLSCFSTFSFSSPLHMRRGKGPDDG